MMGSYSSGYGALMERLDARRGVPSTEEACRVVQSYIDSRNNPYWGPSCDLITLDWALPVVLAAALSAQPEEGPDASL